MSYRWESNAITKPSCPMAHVSTPDDRVVQSDCVRFPPEYTPDAVTEGLLKQIDLGMGPPTPEPDGPPERVRYDDIDDPFHPTLAVTPAVALLENALALLRPHTYRPSKSEGPRESVTYTKDGVLYPTPESALRHSLGEPDPGACEHCGGTGNEPNGKWTPLSTDEAPTDREWTDVEWLRNQWWLANEECDAWEAESAALRAQLREIRKWVVGLRIDCELKLQDHSDIRDHAALRVKQSCAKRILSEIDRITGAAK